MHRHQWRRMDAETIPDWVRDKVQDDETPGNRMDSRLRGNDRLRRRP